MHRANPTRTRTNEIQVALVLLPDYLDASFGITLDFLRTANAVAEAAGKTERFKVCCLTPVEGGVTSAAGVSVPARPLRSAPPAALVVVPGSYIESAEQMHRWITQPWVESWRDYLKRSMSGGSHVAASCAGTWAVAETGALDGCRATTVWWLMSEFGERYPKVQVDLRPMLVEDVNVTTAGAAMAHGELMLAVIARWLGSEVADRCGRVLLADRRKFQSHLTRLELMVQPSPVLRKVHRWVGRNLAGKITLESMAAAAQMTPRTLARRCEQYLALSPLRMVQRQRLEVAEHLLRTTSLPIEAITEKVGYADAAALRRLIKRELGTTATEIRRASA